MPLVLIAATAVSACGGDSGDSDSAGSSSSSTFTIGYGATMSGEFANFGLEMREGVDLAVEEINAGGGIAGAKVLIKSEDDLGKPSNGPLVAQKFCDDDAVRAVLGYSFSSVALAAVPIYSQCTMPVLASAVTSPKLSGSSPYFFRNIFTDAIAGDKMGKYAATVLGLKRIAVFNQQDDYGVGTSDAFMKSAKAAGAEIVSRDAYQLGTKDFNTQLSKIRGAKPDAIYVGGFYAEASKIAVQARNLGMNAQMLGTDGALSPDLVKLGGRAVEGMIFYNVFAPSVDTPEAKRFVAAFEKKFGKEPTSWAALAYDAVHSIKAAADKGGGTSRDAIQKGLKALKELPGATGPTTFDDKGDRLGQIVYLQVTDGQFAVAPEQG